MTKRKASVQRRKLEAYYKAGTCKRCKASIVWNPTGLCRRCKPVVQEMEALEAQEALEAEKATRHFRYHLTVRKKDPSDIGALARAFLGDKSLRDVKGLDAIAMATKPDQIDVRVLEAVWDQSERERLASG